MKKTITLITLSLFLGCANLNKNIDTTEERMPNQVGTDLGGRAGVILECADTNKETESILSFSGNDFKLKETRSERDPSTGAIRKKTATTKLRLIAKSQFFMSNNTATDPVASLVSTDPLKYDSHMNISINLTSGAKTRKAEYVITYGSSFGQVTSSIRQPECIEGKDFSKFIKELSNKPTLHRLEVAQYWDAQMSLSCKDQNNKVIRQVRATDSFVQIIDVSSGVDQNMIGMYDSSSINGNIITYSHTGPGKSSPGYVYASQLSLNTIPQVLNNEKMYEIQYKTRTGLVEKFMCSEQHAYKNLLNKI